MECIYCNKVYKTNSSLNRHKKVSKKCLIIQQTFVEQNELENIKVKLSQMEDRLSLEAKKYSLLEIELKNEQTKSMLLECELKTIKHMNSINHETEHETKQHLPSSIDPMQSIDGNMGGSNNNNTINNNITNTVNINIYTRTDDEINLIYEENINENIIIGGIKSVADLMVKKIFTNNEGKQMIKVTDKSRFNIKYQIPSGETITDTGMCSLMDKHKEYIMKNIHKFISIRPIIGSKIFDTSTAISKGYNSLSDDIDGTKLKKEICKYLE